MNPRDLEGLPNGVVAAPLYQFVPAAQTTGELAEELATKLHCQPLEVELYILRWLCDNGMAIVKRN